MFNFDIFTFAFNFMVPAVCSVEDCPGSVFNTITAAFATQGYYRQADFLYFLSFSEGGLGGLAALIYAVSAFAGIVSMVLGAPPRNYLWFFIGPAVYHWLVGATLPSYGVRVIHGNPAKSVEVGQPDKASEAAQRDVWRIAAPGLRGDGYVRRENITISDSARPSKPAQVGLFFRWVDKFFSNLIEGLIPLTGVYVMPGASGTITGPETGNNAKPKNWSVLTDLKWAKLEDMTSATLRNGDTRDAFITFLASECGDDFSKMINDGNWLRATTGGSKNIPITVFVDHDKVAGNGIGGADSLRQAMARSAIPTPDAFHNMLRTSMTETQYEFKNSNPYFESPPQNDGEIGSNTISCDKYLMALLHAFKFEAAHFYTQMANDAPGEFSGDEDSVVHSLLYGWNVDNLGGGAGAEGGAGGGGLLERRQNFLINLITVYLIRNEFMFAPQPVDVRYSASKQAANYVETQIRTVGSKTKFAEVYTWALMIPYFQGIMLYILAMAYPFVALMVIVPGWHKAIITWMTFWIWVKTWDLGMAVVKVVERSVWSMIGSGDGSQTVFEKIFTMNFMPLTTECAVKADPQGCLLADVKFTSSNMLDPAYITDTFKVLGRALSLAGSLDLDLTNSYYIYIMAALYFAVPGVTGQVVLGAKSGAANLVGGMIQGLGDKAAGAAATGYQGERAAAIQANSASIGQTSFGKAMRRSNLAEQALSQANVGLDAGIQGQEYSSASQIWSGVGQAAERKNAAISSNLAPYGALANPILQRVAQEQGQIAAHGKLQGAQLAPPMRTGAGAGAGAEIEVGAGASAGAGTGAAAAGLMAGQGGGKAAGAQGGGKAAGAQGGGKAAGAPAGAATTPSIGRLADRVRQTLPAYASALPEFLKNDAQLNNLAFQQRIGEDNNARTAAGFEAQGEQTRAQAHSQRLGGYSNFAGEVGAARASVNYANQIAGAAAIVGGMPAGSLVRAQPMLNQDAALGGELGSSALAAANYTAPGSGMQSRVELGRDRLGNAVAQTGAAWGGGADRNQTIAALFTKGNLETAKFALGQFYNVGRYATDGVTGNEDSPGLGATFYTDHFSQLHGKVSKMDEDSEKKAAAKAQTTGEKGGPR